MAPAVRFLHTSDVHLRSDHPERLDALRAVLRIARARDCAAIVIAGDLFDSEPEAIALAPQVRGVLDEADCDVVLIPGNHDRGAFDRIQTLGRRVHLLREAGERVALGEVTFVGVPFERERTAREVLHALPPAPDPAVVVIHASYVPFEFRALADVEDPAGFPLFPPDIEASGYRYLAMGHYHTFAQYAVADKVAVYPGTPARVRISETGPRVAALVELTPAVRVERVELPVEYWEVRSVIVPDWAREAAIERARRLAAQVRRNPRARVHLYALVLGSGADEVRRALEGAADVVDVREHALRAQGDVAQKFVEAVQAIADDPEWRAQAAALFAHQNEVSRIAAEVLDEREALVLRAIEIGFEAMTKQRR